MRNVDGSLFKYETYPNSLPKISFQDIKISNSSDPNFLIALFDSGQIENVELINVEARTYPMFYVQNAGSFSIENAYARNFSGPFISVQQVLRQNLKNLSFYNVSTSEANSLVLLTRYSNTTDIQFKADNQSTVLSDFFIDVWKIKGLGNDFIIGI